MYKCPPWTQGPVFLQQLALLQGYDLSSLGHNSEEYVHVFTECTKLVFADREAYYGDPKFDDVPLQRLLSDDYNKERRRLVSAAASREMRPGDVGRGCAEYATVDVLQDNRRALGLRGDAPVSAEHSGDTTHLDAADAAGNLIAATPSGGWIQSSPVIKGLGFPLGTRAQMFYLNARRPNALAPHKRPRTTLTPTLVMKKREPFMAFGTPGGDTQDQTTLQFFLNVVDFGMDLQEALDAPTVYSEHFPSSFYPRERFPARLCAEDRIPEHVLRGLERRGHEVVTVGGWVNGKVMGICFDREHGVIEGAASPKGNIGYAFGW